jgi:hypothetical protein
MPLPTKVLPGFVASLYVQPSATPTPLTTAQLSLIASVSPLTVIGNLLQVEAVPVFGQDDAVASFGVAGSRQSDKLPTQSAPTSLTITVAWNPSDTVLLLVRADAYSGLIDRTYIVQATDGTGTINYAFNARVGQFQIDAQPGAEAKAIFTLHPRGNQYGWTNTA